MTDRTIQSRYRLSLRSQITLSVGLLIILTVASTSLINGFVAANRVRDEIDSQIEQIVSTLRDPRFPLVDSTLSQVSQLSGAEYALTNSQSKVIAASFESPRLLLAPPPSTKFSLRDAPTRDLQDEAFFHIAIDLPKENSVASESRTLHVLYPQARYQAAWRDSMLFPIATGVIAMLLVFGLAYQLAKKITQPIESFREGVNLLTEGRFTPIPEPARNDEVRDLVLAINTLAGRLEKYESEIRSNERLRTLGQLGAGLAHQLKNAVTGCRLGLDLHQRDCPQANDQSLVVAGSQLSLMEEYLNRFLAIGKQTTFEPKVIDLVEVVTAAVQLIEPMAKHSKVSVHVASAPDHLPLFADSHLLCQLLVNLLMNAVEAVSKANHVSPGNRAVLSEDGSNTGESAVWVQYSEANAQVTIEVIDCGMGPAAEMKNVLFEPLQTDKPEGTGLGLSVANEIAKQHRGRLDWSREQGRTRFFVVLPQTDRPSDKA